MKVVRTVMKSATVACAAGFLAVVCLAIYAAATGLLSDANFKKIGMALRDELVAPQPETEAKHTLEEEYRLDALKEAQKALAALKEQEELVRITLNERRAQIAMLEGSAAQLSKSLAERADALAQSEEAFGKQRDAFTAGLAAEGFKKTIKTLGILDAPKAAEMIYNAFSEDEALRLLWAMKDDLRASLLTEIDLIDKQNEATGAAAKATNLLKRLSQLSAQGAVAARRTTE